MITVLNRIFLGVIVMISAGRFQIAAQVTPQSGTAAAACDGSDIKTVPAGVKSVTLSWSPSVPASAQPRDAVIGYIVYRSTTPHNPSALPINIRRLTDTACVDTQVQGGETYYYMIRSVSASGALSGPSTEVSVRIPAHAPGSKD